MRYAQGGGVDAAGRARRAALRMQAAEMSTEDVGVDEVARCLRVSVRSVYRWRAAFARGGTAVQIKREVAGEAGRDVGRGSGGARLG
ncbi:MAG: hypothetical protein HOW97_36560 [Catenulispora sp.]|nr:hypothetical protein [Catenulispora sp.]